MADTGAGWPVRHRRERRKGYRMPEGAVYVGRPSKFGNPFKVGQLVPAGWLPTELALAEKMVPLTPLLAKRAFESWIYNTGGYHVRYAAIEKLRGKDLVCWCPLDAPCHADVLLEIANV